MHHTQKATRTASTVALVVLLALTVPACLNIRFARHGEPSPTAAPTPQPTALEVSAQPAFRLALDRWKANLPTRLVAVRVRVTNLTDRAIVIAPEKIRFGFPNRTARTAFDRPRAAELVRRTFLARADLFYLTASSSPPTGGFTPREARGLSTRLSETLLDRHELAPEATVEGYVVVDTGVALRTMDGSLIEVSGAWLDQQESRWTLRTRVAVGSPVIPQ